MRIKKKYIGTTIFTAGSKIHLGEVISDVLMKRLELEFPKYLEEEKDSKPKKVKKTSPFIS